MFPVVLAVGHSFPPVPCVRCEGSHRAGRASSGLCVKCGVAGGLRFWEEEAQDGLQLEGSRGSDRDSIEPGRGKPADFGDIPEFCAGWAEAQPWPCAQSTLKSQARIRWSPGMWLCAVSEAAPARRLVTRVRLLLGQRALPWPWFGLSLPFM